MRNKADHASKAAEEKTKKWRQCGGVVGLSVQADYEL